MGGMGCTCARGTKLRARDTNLCVKRCEGNQEAALSAHLIMCFDCAACPTAHSWCQLDAVRVGNFRCTQAACSYCCCCGGAPLKLVEARMSSSCRRRCEGRGLCSASRMVSMCTSLAHHVSCNASHERCLQQNVRLVTHLARQARRRTRCSRTPLRQEPAIYTSGGCASPGNTVTLDPDRDLVSFVVCEARALRQR